MATTLPTLLSLMLGYYIPPCLTLDTIRLNIRATRMTFECTYTTYIQVEQGLTQCIFPICQYIPRYPSQEKGNEHQAHSIEIECIPVSIVVLIALFSTTGADVALDSTPGAIVWPSITKDHAIGEMVCMHPIPMQVSLLVAR